VLQDDGAHLVVQADWTGQPRDLGLVQFVPGDVFTEHYWRDRWYSVKEVRDTAGARKGWYCDVCRPPVRRRGQVLTDDLDLDLWASADLTTIARLDEEEFAASDVAQRNPVVAGRATAALAELEALARSGFTELG
jgi:predicted RNA-binding protein associated with RNAse of E/G family